MHQAARDAVTPELLAGIVADATSTKGNATTIITTDAALRFTATPPAVPDSLPIALPVAEAAQFDMIWFGVITVVAVEAGLL